MADDSLALSLIIPLHNEAGTLVSLYQEIKEVLDGLGMTYEIIFVNDASTDDTPEILRQLKTIDSHIRVIEHKKIMEKLQLFPQDLKFFVVILLLLWMVMDRMIHTTFRKWCKR